MTAFANEQGDRTRKLWAAVVLVALDDAIDDYRKGFDGAVTIRRWAMSRDGREVLQCAGIEHTTQAVDGLVAFVERGVRTSSVNNKKEAK